MGWAVVWWAWREGVLWEKVKMAFVCTMGFYVGRVVRCLPELIYQDGEDKH